MTGWKVVWRFMGELAEELSESQELFWNVKRLIIFHMMILQRAQHVTGSQAIRWRIMMRLDAWEAYKHQTMVEGTEHTCNN